MYRLTTLFGYVISVLLLIVSLLLIILQNILKNQRLFDQTIKFLCRMILWSFGIRVQVDGLKELDPHRGYIFFSNHVNLLDPVLLYGYIPRFVRGVELDTHFSWPLWGTIIKRMGHIPISHKDTKSALESLEKAGDIIKKGTSIIIFPEGHRTRDGRIKTFQRGPFRLARNAGAEMIPIGLSGMWERNSVHSIFIKPGPVKITFGESIPPQLIQSMSDRDLRVLGKQRVKDILEFEKAAPERAADSQKLYQS